MVAAGDRGSSPYLYEDIGVLRQLLNYVKMIHGGKIQQGDRPAG